MGEKEIHYYTFVLEDEAMEMVRKMASEHLRSETDELEMIICVFM